MRGCEILGTREGGDSGWRGGGKGSVTTANGHGVSNFVSVKGAAVTGIRKA